LGLKSPPGDSTAPSIFRAAAASASAFRTDVLPGSVAAIGHNDKMMMMVIMMLSGRDNLPGGVGVKALKELGIGVIAPVVTAHRVLGRARTRPAQQDEGVLLRYHLLERQGVVPLVAQIVGIDEGITWLGQQVCQAGIDREEVSGPTD
jgi:hypothetical protein